MWFMGLGRLSLLHCLLDIILKSGREGEWGTFASSCRGVGKEKREDCLRALGEKEREEKRSGSKSGGEESMPWQCAALETSPLDARTPERDSRKTHLCNGIRRYR